MDFKKFYDALIFDVDRSILKSYQGKQGDTKSRGIYVTIAQQNVVVEELAGLSMRLFYEKPDKTRGFIDGVIDDGKFRIDYTNQMYAVPGVVKAELRLSGTDGEIISNKTFQIVVDASIADGSIVSKDERVILDRAFELAEDIIPRIELLDVELLEDVQDEMLGARHSNTKDESYDSLGQRLDAAEQDLLDHKAEYTSNRQQDQLKVAKVEKELNDYQKVMSMVNVNQEPKQKVSGYGTVSLPKNAANGQISVVLKGFTNTNLVPYPKMDTDSNSDGIVDGFTTDTWSCSPSRSLDGGQKITMGGATVSQAYAGVQTSGYIPVSAGKTYTLSVEAKLVRSAAETVEFVLMWYDVNNTMISNNGLYNQNPGTNYQRLSFTVTAPANAAKVKVHLRLRASSTSDTGSVWFKNIQLEPNPQASSFIVGTKSTFSAMRIRNVGKNLWDKVREKWIKKAGGVLTVIGDSYSYQRTSSANHDEIYRDIKVEKNTNYSFSVNITRQGTGTIRLGTPDNRDKFGYFIGVTGMRSVSFTTEADEILRVTILGSSLGSFIDFNNPQLEKGTVATTYEPYIESNAYVIIKDEEENIIELRSLPNDAKDEIDVVSRRLIKRIGEKTNVSNGTVINYTDMAENGTYYAWNEDGETETGIKGDTLGIDATTLIYQLAEPVEMPIQVSGSLISHPNGTVFIEPIVADAGVYADKMEVLHEDLPIKAIEKVSKVDFMTGVETELDIEGIVIAENQLSFTHPDLTEGDIVFFVYEHGAESTIPETEISYYDSRYVIKGEDDKFYQWEIEAKLVEGVITPSIKLVEV
jgi:hypothetical protein